MSKTGGGGNAGFKVVKSSPNRKEKAPPKQKKVAATITATTVDGGEYCKNKSTCTNGDCDYEHDVPMCRKFKNCKDPACQYRHKFRWVGEKRMCAVDVYCTVRNCHYNHTAPICSADFKKCTDAACKARHGRKRNARAVDGGLKVSPFSIWFSQPSIHCRFNDGTTFEEKTRHILEGTMLITLVVDFVRGVFVAINNRTLYCFMKAKVESVEVTLIHGILEAKGRKICGRTVKFHDKNRKSKKQHYHIVE